MKKHGFLMNDVTFIVNRDDFLSSHHNNLYISRKDRQIVKSYETGLTYTTNNIVSTLGEFFEREVLINNNPIKRTNLLATSLYNGDICQVETNKIVFNKKFVDSSGMASHTNSLEVIHNSFLEFFERQCLVLSYLSQDTATFIEIPNYGKHKKYDEYLKQFVDETQYFNISIHKNLFVVLLIATGKVNKSVGLGTSPCLKKAVVKAQKEALQYFATSISKYNEKRENDFLESSVDMDQYHQNFNSLSSNEIKNKYSYLYDKKKTSSIISTSFSSTFNVSTIIKDLKKEFDIHPYITTIFSKRNIPNLKVVKVFDENWFPHIHPKFYDEETYDYIESKIGRTLNRDIETIPFP